MPFDAMKGLQEALRDREERHGRVKRHDLPEEYCECNSRILKQLHKGDRIRLECYMGFHDVRLEGTVTELSLDFGYIILGDDKVYFENIYSVALVEKA